MKREATGGAVVAVIFTAGIFLVRMTSEEPRPGPASPQPPPARGGGVGGGAGPAVPVPDEVASLRSALAASQERASELEKRLVAAETALSQQSSKPIAEKKLDDKKAFTKGEKSGKDERPLDPKEAEERVRALLEKTNWDAGARALVAAWTGRGKKLDAANRDAIQELFQATSEINKLRGQPALMFRPLSDPEVRARFVPGWVSALAGGLDAGQTESVRARVAADNATHVAEPAPTTLVAQVRRDFADKLALEQELARIMRPEQHQAYLAAVTDDPFFGEKLGRQEIPVTAAGPGPVAAALVLEWMRSFDLAETARDAVSAVARTMADGVVRVPAVDAALPLGERRLQNLRRVIATMDLQLRAEQQLAEATTLSDEERARAREGGHSILEFVPER